MARSYPYRVSQGLRSSLRLWPRPAPPRRRSCCFLQGSSIAVPSRCRVLSGCDSRPRPPPDVPPPRPGCCFPLTRRSHIFVLQRSRVRSCWFDLSMSATYFAPIRPTLLYPTVLAIRGTKVQPGDGTVLGHRSRHRLGSDCGDVIVRYTRMHFLCRTNAEVFQRLVLYQCRRNRFCPLVPDRVSALVFAKESVLPRLRRRMVRLWASAPESAAAPCGPIMFPPTHILRMSHTKIQLCQRGVLVRYQTSCHIFRPQIADRVLSYFRLIQHQLRYADLDS